MLGLAKYSVTFLIDKTQRDTFTADRPRHVSDTLLTTLNDTSLQKSCEVGLADKTHRAVGEKNAIA